MRKKILIISVILIVVLMSMVSCSAVSKFFSNANTVNYQISVDDLEDVSIGSIVASNSVNSCARIVSYFNIGGSQHSVSGAGFIITADGYLITNRHVVVVYTKNALSSDYKLEKDSTYNYAKEPTEIRVVFADRTYVTATLCYYIDDAEELDLAILKLNPITPTVYTSLQIDKTSTLYYGQSVFTFGNPEGIGLLFTTANIANPSMPLSSEARYESIMIDGNINHGNSGGVLLDNNSRVIGVVFARVEAKSGSSPTAYGIGCAIKSADLVDFIDGSGLKSSINYSIYNPGE